jgi:hypothetical protein
MMCVSDLPSIKNSIQPVITKCKPDNQDLDIDMIRSDIEEIITPHILSLEQIETVKE